MNIKRFVPALVAVFAVVFLYDWFLHGVLLHDTYMATKQLWRPEAEMQQFFPYMVGGQFLFALFFCLIFIKGYEAKGLLEGVRFGIYIALLVASRDLILYAVQPLPCAMVLSWMGGMLVECVLAGIAMATIYRR